MSFAVADILQLRCPAVFLWVPYRSQQIPRATVRFFQMACSNRAAGPPPGLRGEFEELDRQVASRTPWAISFCPACLFSCPCCIWRPTV
eukprot:3351851-Pyramimonas_sp.AAC.1